MKRCLVMFTAFSTFPLISLTACGGSGKGILTNIPIQTTTFTSIATIVQTASPGTVRIGTEGIGQVVTTVAQIQEGSRWGHNFQAFNQM